MTANIWKDGNLVFWSIEVSLTDLPDASNSRQWEGIFRIVGNEKFDVSGRCRLELDDGKSAEIVLTPCLRREPAIVHFRVLAWKDKAHVFNSAP